MSTTSSIPCDPMDFGQVFACVGLMECEAAASGSGGAGVATGRFGEVGDEPSFTLESPAGIELGELVEALARAEIVALAPHGSDVADAKVTTEPFAAGERVFPSPPPENESALPVEVRTPGWSVRVSSWAEDDGYGRDSAKFWGGKYTGASVMWAVSKLLADVDGNEAGAARADPFGFARRLSSGLRLDYRRDYVPLDSGTSPNKQSSIVMVGHPLVELLGAIGLERARPGRVSRTDKLAYRYAVPRSAVPLSLLRAVVGGGDCGIRTRRFLVRLDWPGQENQARCITRVSEEEANR